MFDLREHKGLIHSLVAEANENDTNWKWSVKSVGKTKARIFWSYLEYCGQPEPYFVIELEDTGDGYWTRGTATLRARSLLITTCRSSTARSTRLSRR